MDSEKVFVNNATIKTTKDLVDYIENAKNLDGFVSINWHLPRKITHPRKNPQNVKKVSSFFVLKDKGGHYYAGKTARVVICARILDFAKKFGNEAMVSRYIAKYSLQDRGFDVIERVEAEAYI